MVVDRPSCGSRGCGDGVVMVGSDDWYILSSRVADNNINKYAKPDRSRSHDQSIEYVTISSKFQSTNRSAVDHTVN